MKRFRCGDVVPGCTATFTGTEDQIVRAVLDHAEADHGVSGDTAPLVSSVRAAITEA